MANHNHKNQNTLNLFLNNYFNFFLAGVLILFFILAYWFLLGPKFRATKAAIETNIAEQEKIYVNEQKKLADLQALVALYKKINPADLQKFNSVLPDNYVRERLFGEFEEIVGQGGWLINSLTIIKPEDIVKVVKPASVQTTDEEGNPLPAAEQSAPSVKDKKLGQVYLELSLGAIDYAGFKNLLRLLENNLRLFDITGVDFSPTSGTATLKLSTYYYQSIQ